MAAGAGRAGGAEALVAVAAGAGRRGRARRSAGNAVRAWLNVAAGRHLSFEWQLAQLRPSAPRWTSLRLVAADAGHRRLEAGDRADVARRARHAAMRAAQREAGAAVMIEFRPLPRQRRVASRASGSVGAAMDVVLAMAGDARHRRPRAFLARAVARCAGYRLHGVRPAGSGCGCGRTCAPFHDIGEWQLAQSRPLAPLWTSSSRWQATHWRGVPAKRLPTWQAAHCVFWCAPTSGNPVTLWSNARMTFHPASLWQLAQLRPKRPSCSSSFAWQATQASGAARNGAAGTWQLRHCRPRCLPPIGKLVF